MIRFSPLLGIAAIKIKLLADDVSFRLLSCLIFFRYRLLPGSDSYRVMLVIRPNCYQVRAVIRFRLLSDQSAIKKNHQATY